MTYKKTIALYLRIPDFFPTNSFKQINYFWFWKRFSFQWWLFALCFFQCFTHLHQRNTILLLLLSETVQLHKRGWSYAKLFFIVQSRMSLGISQINLPEFVWFVPCFIGSKCKMTRILIFFLSLIIVSDLWFYQSTDKEKILAKAERFLKDQRIHWPKSHFKYTHTATNKNRYNYI